MNHEYAETKRSPLQETEQRHPVAHPRGGWLSEKQQIEAVGKRITTKHDRRFVKKLIEWLDQHLPPRRKTQPSKEK